MHEMALMRDLVRKINEVAAREKSPRVVKITVWLGALSHLTQEHFLDHFRDDAKNTPASGAAVEFEISRDQNDPKARDVVLKSVEVAE